MIRLTELKLPLEALPVEHRRAADAPTETEADRTPPPQPIETLRVLAAQVLHLQPSDIVELTVFKRSFDARKAQLQAVFIVDVHLNPALSDTEVMERARSPHVLPTPDMSWHPPVTATHDMGEYGERPVVVGFGPCGMLAALTLAQMGCKPLVLERGTTVRQRTKDTWGLWRKKMLNPESNVQFGEGGAGTFSDGKLYSQIKDPRHLGRKVMHEFVQAGAPAEILVEAHPHIGTFKLVKVVEGIREQILALGGEIRFEQRVTDVLLGEDETGHKRVLGLKVLDGSVGQSYDLCASHVVMALGHSARDTFAMLFDRGVEMHAKPFSVGFRIEHPQGLIDRARWGQHAGHPLLGAADYKLVHHASNGRTVYSFCMCPGGTVVAATSEPGRVVTNGMSQYSRNERNANAGIVVGIDPQDYPNGLGDVADWQAAFGDELGLHYALQATAMTQQQPAQHHPLAGIVLQRKWEAQAYALGGKTYLAPAQLVGDFMAARPSDQLGSVQPSYKPGVLLGSLDQALPGYAIEAIREALPAFGKKIKGFDMPQAVLTGVETRTSSPLRMPRGDNLQSLNVRGLYPAGEGAGYAGGILSAGVDGIKVAEALATDLLKQN